MAARQMRQRSKTARCIAAAKAGRLAGGEEAAAWYFLAYSEATPSAVHSMQKFLHSETLELWLWRRLCEKLPSLILLHFTSCLFSISLREMPEKLADIPASLVLWLCVTAILIPSEERLSHDTEATSQFLTERDVDSERSYYQYLKRGH